VALISRPTPKSGPKRGAVVRVRLDPIEGSEQAGQRPALVLSPDLINESSPVVIVAAITSRKKDRVFPFETLIAEGEAGLPRESKVMLMQLRTIDKARIVGYYGAVSEETLCRVEEALRIVVGLTRL